MPPVDKHDILRALLENKTGNNTPIHVYFSDSIHVYQNDSEIDMSSKNIVKDSSGSTIIVDTNMSDSSVKTNNTNVGENSISTEIDTLMLELIQCIKALPVEERENIQKLEKQAIRLKEDIETGEDIETINSTFEALKRAGNKILDITPAALKTISKIADIITKLS